MAETITPDSFVMDLIADGSVRLAFMLKGKQVGGRIHLSPEMAEQVGLMLNPETRQEAAKHAMQTMPKRH